MEKMGAYAFLLGVIIAVIIGAASTLITTLDAQVKSASAVVLVLLGLVVGFLNIHEKEATTFLVASIALAIGVGGAGAFAWWGAAGTATLGGVLQAILANISIFVIPAAIVVALKAIWDSAGK